MKKTPDYAVNIGDLLRDPMLGILIARVSPNKIIRATEADHFDGAGIVLECNEERAKAIIAIIRLKYKAHEVRCYRGTKRI